MNKRKKKENVCISSGSVHISGQDLVAVEEDEVRKWRGGRHQTLNISGK
jgi:hypothetical protein